MPVSGVRDVCHALPEGCQFLSKPRSHGLQQAPAICRIVLRLLLPTVSCCLMAPLPGLHSVQVTTQPQRLASGEAPVALLLSTAKLRGKVSVQNITTEISCYSQDLDCMFT